MTDYDDDNSGWTSADHETALRMGRFELEYLRWTIDVDQEAIALLAALDAGQVVMATPGWGTAERTEAYVSDLRERLAVAMEFPATPWWRAEDSADDTPS